MHGKVLKSLRSSADERIGRRWIPSLLVGLTFASVVPPTWGQSVVESKTILVEATAPKAGWVSSSDTAALLNGVDSAQAGGVSGLPSIHGLADDRIRIVLNGAPVAAACPMHMNSPLSYIDPSHVGRIEVLPGVTPVSLGGDSIGGTILVESPPPVFAATDHALEHNGRVASFYRSNSASFGAAATATVASSDFSLAYEGSASRAADYHDGNGERINASRFKTSNQQITAAYRSGPDLYEARAALQYLPYEGFPNGDMDLTGNVGAFIDTRYKGVFSWGNLHFNAYYDHIRHQMNGNAPDRYPFGISLTAFGVFPTEERAQDFGYRVEADLAASTQDTLRIGNELHAQTLDDRWPGAPAGMMFDYVNINNATRMQWGTFAEWERRWSERLTTLLGSRNDTVSMHAGPVQGYNGIEPAAEAFNASDRARTDVNIDATLMLRYQPDHAGSYALGLARKNRSPNFYERFAWGANTMGTVTWFGDGNGYTGDPNLKPEAASTASVSGNWHGRGARPWELQLTAYFTTVQDYIGAVPICDSLCSGMPASQLMFVNQRAHLYGADFNEAHTLFDSAAAGVLRLTGSGGFVRGENLSAHTSLYHMMPLHGTLALEHQRGGWSSALELHATGRKNRVDATRLEPQTAGHEIFDLRTAYEWHSVRLDLAVKNLLDRQYDNPLSGTWQSALYPPGYGGATFRPLPAAGRSFDTGITVKF